MNVMNDIAKKTMVSTVKSILNDTGIIAELHTAATNSLKNLSEEAKQKIGAEMALFNQQYVYPHGFAPTAAPGAVAPAATGGKSKTRKRAASRKRSRSRKSKSDK